MRRRLAVLATLALVVAAVGPVPTEAASKWTARTTWTGSLGSLGSASLGVGSPDHLIVRAESLKAGTVYAVTLRRGTCAKSGTLVMSKRMTATRARTISQTVFLTSAQTRFATLPLAVRVGSRCAPLLAPLGVATTTVGSASSTVPAGGGTAQAASGASVVFPPGALTSDAKVSITELAASSTSSQGSAAAWPSQPVGDLYRIDTSASFGAPVTLMLPVPASAPTGGLALAYFNPATGSWLPVPSTVDATAQRISAQVDHLSTWGIFDLSSWLVALNGLAAGDLHSFLQGTYDLLTPCQPGTGPWHIDNTHASSAVEGCAKSQTDQSLSLVVRNLRLYPLEISSSGYLNKTVIDAGEATPPLSLSRTYVPPATILASMTQDTMYTAVAMSFLDEISLIAPLGDSVGVETVTVAGHKVALSAISALASAIKLEVKDIGPIWNDLKAGNLTQASFDFTALFENQTILATVSTAIAKIGAANGWEAVVALGDVGMKVALVALAPLLAGKVIVELLTMDADYFFSPQNSVSVTWDRVAPAATSFSISGRVTDPSGAPLGGILVQTGQTNGSGSGSTTYTTSDGRYSFSGIPAGQYVVSDSDPSNRYVASEHTGFIIVPPDATGVDIQNQPGIGISGTVIGPGGTPRSRVAVDVCWSLTHWCACVSGPQNITGVDGRYSGLVPAGTYKIGFVDWNGPKDPSTGLYPTHYLGVGGRYTDDWNQAVWLTFPPAHSSVDVQLP